MSKKSKFRVPYINGKYLVGLGFLVALALAIRFNGESVAEWMDLGSGALLLHKSLVIVFWGVWLLLSVLSFKYNFSLLPVVGVLVNLYLMSELGASNWIIFLLWLLGGLAIYFAYGYRHSKLRTKQGTV